MNKEILKTGIHTIGMVKQLEQRYTYNGKQYKFSELKKFIDFGGAGNIFGSLVVTTKTGIPVKIVFIRNRNKKSECLYILSTNVSLKDAEIVRIYGDRWSIVSTRYIILEWIRRNQNDWKTYSELFFMFYDDIQDMDLTNALQSLMALFVEHILTLSADITFCIKSKVTEWMMFQAHLLGF